MRSGEASSAVPNPLRASSRGSMAAGASTPSIGAQKADSSSLASQFQTAGGTCTIELSVHSALSGDLIASFPQAPTSWTGAEVKQWLAEEAPLQPSQFYQLLCGSELLGGRRSLAECCAIGASDGKVDLIAIVRELGVASVAALQAAMDALDKLDKRSISEIRAYARPPEMVVKTMCAVMTVMEKTPSVLQFKVEMGDVMFLRRIKGFDKDNITDVTLRKIQKYTKDPNFTPQLVQKVSVAAAALCQWVHAMKIYAEVYSELEAERNDA